ncbi:hypothetical protein GUITHDRAFT_120579 [Guillardia theta CCMP2712]|uniref:Uncharacterized protein n=1 Tax=Guillardia theta (strain CCMP2712) TaxID=905079 RepID=L1IBI5_GUITC|nr:hypothetical protein GUITHDRAFT_120579 [Guillardia theta CCMP2712]EKX33264.1 hypothetical protein GUITHDRAFT_120579 [Guillardia theta CCMP2712]|eukprot:XP_005820244.1 hypothetical protein GUITHDRAFT_120579 [Guillardia theta CCMP2712]
MYAESWNAIENFVGWRVQNDGKMLAMAMAKCESCSVYDLSYNGLGDNEGKEIAKALKINFTKNEKPYAGVPGAKIYGTIVKLNLANNNLHAEGIRALCEALTSSNPRISFSLEELGLANNAAGPEGAVELAKVISSNRIIRRLNLSWNNIGTTGVLAILNALQQSHLKAKFDLSYNSIDLGDQTLLESWPELITRLKRMKIKDRIEEVIVGWELLGLHTLPTK